MLFPLVLLLTLSLSFGQTLYVAAASSLQRLMPQLVEEFKSYYPGVKVKVSFASSGHLYAQIAGGAPYHVFVSADSFYTKKLIRRKKALKDSYTEYAKGLLALYGNLKGSDIKRTLEEAKRVAVANPRHAPYGKAAVQALKSLGLYERLRRKLVYGANVSQALQFVHSGGADVGIVALSLVVGRDRYITLPEELYRPVIHSAVITLKGKDSEPAKEFINFLTSQKAKEVLKRFGFKVEW